MTKPQKIVLSLFHGMNCIGCALERIDIEAVIYGSEIDKYATQVSDALFPDTLNLGDVRGVIASMELELMAGNIDTIDLIIAGSPCKGFSFAGKQLNFEDPESKLFFEFVEILNWCREKINPNVKFLLENVEMKKEYQDIISRLVGIDPIVINSSLVSAQNRKRLYWTNIGTTTFNFFGIEEPSIRQPKDLGIVLRDVLEDEVDEKYNLSQKGFDFVAKPLRIKKKYTAIDGDKALTLTAKGQTNWTGTFIKIGTAKNGKEIFLSKNSNLPCSFSEARTQKGKEERKIISAKKGFDSCGRDKDSRMYVSKKDQKSNCLTTVNDFSSYIVQKEKAHVHNAGTIRRLTPRECGRLQTFTEEELDVILNCGVSDSQLYKMLGNGWTVAVIAWILKHLEW